MSTVSPTTPHAHPAWHVAWRSAVVVLGDLAVLGAAFFAYAAYQNAFRALFFHGDVAPWLRATETGLVLLAIAGATWWALHRWPTSLGTALWLAVPAAAVLLTIGIWAYPAELLGIGINTLSHHVKNLYPKLAATSRSEAVYRAVREGILRLDA